MVTAMMSPTTMGMAGTMTGGMGMPSTGASPAMNVPMVPRCTMKVEKCQGGMKIVCTCDDPTACSMMQNLCTTLTGGLCSCCCMMNGMMVSCCNLVMGMCKCEMTPKGCTITCTSGDPKCCEMIQGCCEAVASMIKAGCTCCLMMNNTPVCCCC